MNEKLEQTLQAILEKALTIAEQTGEFAMEQAPILLQEFYMWHTSKAILLILFSFIISIISIYVTRLLGGDEDKSNYCDSYFNFIGKWYLDISGAFIMIFLFIAPQIVSLIMFFSSTLTLIKILVAPRLYLIEYFM